MSNNIKLSDCDALKEKYVQCIKENSKISSSDMLESKTGKYTKNDFNNIKFNDEINKKCNSNLYSSCISEGYNFNVNSSLEQKLIDYLSKEFDKNYSKN